jgi:hypothetical protein
MMTLRRGDTVWVTIDGARFRATIELASENRKALAVTFVCEGT